MIMIFKNIVSEARPTNILGLIVELKKLPSVEKIIEITTQRDGMSALVRTTDGNAYEIQIRQAEFAQHPDIKKKTK